MTFLDIFHPGEWYIGGTMKKAMVLASAREYARRTSRPQIVHNHQPGEDCDNSCVTVSK